MGVLKYGFESVGLEHFDSCQKLITIELMTGCIQAEGLSKNFSSVLFKSHGWSMIMQANGDSSSQGQCGLTAE